jgi:hypothetical protein
MKDKKKQLKVVYSDYGLANNFGDYIEINRHFSGDTNKVLRDAVIRHELGHLTSFDLKHEYKIPWKIMPKLIWFVIKHPKTWVDFLPFQFRKIENEWVFVKDYNVLIQEIIAIVLLGLLIFVAHIVFKWP